MTTTSAALEERLSSLLSSSSFSVASYINAALEGQDNPEDLQRRMAELALQLQIQTQSCHEDIGRIGAELQAILPRCAADVGRVGVGLEGMRMDAHQLLEESALLQNAEVSNSLETLSTLHALRSNLGHTKDIVKAAATWDTSLNSIPPLLAAQNLTEAVKALALLESGERALRGMPSGRAEREEAIATTRSQVQVMLTPQLKHALQNMNTRLAPLQQCVTLYSALDKMELLQQEYISNRPQIIHKQWFQYDPASGDTLELWLPSWYELVLNLVTEERRQSLAVFGADLGPDMTAKVLGECFRPIMSSFQARIESVYSKEGISMTGGSLESICHLYESTLQFLAMAYEIVAGGWHDVADVTSTNGSTVYANVTSAFLLIAQPFSVYQTNLAKLEKKHSAISQQMVAKDIQQAVGGVSNSIGILQDATEKLKGLAPFIFPLAEAAVGRFELMTGGFRTAENLQAIDGLMKSHAGELSIAIRTLSAAMTSDSHSFADTFDDQHVLCALEVLKVAGIFQRCLADIEIKSREQMTMLRERMVSFASQENAFLESSAKSFMLPDSLSVVEIDSFITKAVLSGLDDEGNAQLLQRLGSKDSSMAVVYPESKDAVAGLASSCHAFVFDVCCAVPRKRLANVSNMPCWTEASDTNAYDSYGTLPQSYITLVGEHMLALVQALEPFASDPVSLALADEVMGGVQAVAKQAWREVATATGVTDSVVPTLMNGKELMKYVSSGFEDSGELDMEEDDDEDMDAATKASASFCNKWLDVVGLAVTGFLLEKILRIPKLTPKGCEHLSVDLNYLVNVLAALGVSGHPHPLVSHVAELAVMDCEDLQAQIRSRDRNIPFEGAVLSIEQRVALVRGIPVN